MSYEPIPNMIPAVPEIFLAVVGLGLLVYGVFRGDGATRAVSWMCVFALTIALVMQFAVEPGRIVTFSGMFVSDGFAVFMKILVLGASALALGSNIRFWFYSPRSAC